VTSAQNIEFDRNRQKRSNQVGRQSKVTGTTSKKKKRGEKKEKREKKKRVYFFMFPFYHASNPNSQKAQRIETSVS
jgi:hypothetical protein